MKKILLVSALCMLFSCSTKTATIDSMLVNEKDFVGEIDGKKVELVTLKNGNIAAQFTNFGARLVSLVVPDAEGNFTDVVWGYSSLENYINATDQYSGPIVGRYGNRINKGIFTLDSVEYSVTINNDGNHLHGGVGGFSTRVWEVKSVSEKSVVMSYFSADGEEGYPGNATLEVTYTLNDNCALEIDYKATTDAPTVINPTSHAYFNLNGDASSALEHVLTMKASNYTPTIVGLIPTGEIASVLDTPLDFTTPHSVGERINEEFEALKLGFGYDHNFVFDTVSLDVAQVELYSPKSGIVMTMNTDQPAVQFYSGNFMDGVDTGKRGDKHNYRTGIALEAQNYPDAPNHANFPNSVLREGETYTQTTIYTFSVK